jgi:putative PIN family toxin of toxin-antitoxin system
MISDNLYRVIFDTSTLISAVILPGSLPSAAIKLAINACSLWASKETLLELKEVLNRPHLDRYATPELRTKFFNWYLESIKVILVKENVTDCRDKRDDKFLSLALATQAHFIISGDADLLTLNPYRSNISIIKPKDFLEQIEKLKATAQSNYSRYNA